MTVSYNGNFSRLLLKWRGSLWKTIYVELIIFLILYYIINFIYRFALNPGQQDTFEKVAVVCNFYVKQIPLTFLLGFYVGILVKRWWEQFVVSH